MFLLHIPSFRLNGRRGSPRVHGRILGVKCGVQGLHSGSTIQIATRALSSSTSGITAQRNLFLCILDMLNPLHDSKLAYDLVLIC